MCESRIRPRSTLFIRLRCALFPCLILRFQLLLMNRVGSMQYAVGCRAWTPREAGRHQLTRYPTLEAAKASFTKQFLRFTGNAWEHRDRGDKLGKGTVGHTAHEWEQLV